eukprot:IDg1577t1
MQWLSSPTRLGSHLSSKGKNLFIIAMDAMKVDWLSDHTGALYGAHYRAILSVLVRVASHFAKPIARVRVDNANELLTKYITAFCARLGIHIDPTVAHTPTGNAVAERTNRTLMDRVRVTLATAQLPFYKYWSLCLLDTTSKINYCYQRTVQDFPRRLWEQHRSTQSPILHQSLSLFPFRMFGEYGFVLDLVQSNKKAAARGILVQYLYTIDDNHYKIMNPRTGRLFTCRHPDFHPYNSKMDPNRLYHNALPTMEAINPRVNLHHVIPRWASCTQETATAKARPVPASSHPIRLRFHHALDPAGRLASHPMLPAGPQPIGKNRIYIHLSAHFRHRLVPGIHYNTSTLAAYAADRAAIRVVLERCVHNDMLLHHIDFTAAFLRALLRVPDMGHPTVMLGWTIRRGHNTGRYTSPSHVWHPKKQAHLHWADRRGLRCLHRYATVNIWKLSISGSVTGIMVRAAHTYSGKKHPSSRIHRDKQRRARNSMAAQPYHRTHRPTPAATLLENDNLGAIAVIKA